jgi:alanine racemase
VTTSISCETARAWVDVDLGALVANARTVAEVSGGRLLPMVKANGYGLGAVRVACALERVDPWGFGVATLEEGAELRQAGIVRPIVLFTPLLPEWLDRCLELELRPSIGDLDMLRAWTARSARPFHVEIDTGMSRSGFGHDDAELFGAAAEVLRAALGWEGVLTHFHSPEADGDATEQQWTRFQATIERLPRRPTLVHAANSAAAVSGRRYTADLVRPGIFLYGGGATRPAVRAVPKPVAALRARVVALRQLAAGDTVSYGATWRAERPTTIATLAAGYADGIPRAAGRGPRHVELGGRVVPMVGRVAMDMIMVALPDDHAVAPGDIATIWGGLVSLDQQAEAAGTVAYELLTMLGTRVPRRYLTS